MVFGTVTGDAAEPADDADPETTTGGTAAAAPPE
jgi:hypothetical protein